MSSGGSTREKRAPGVGRIVGMEVVSGLGDGVFWVGLIALLLDRGVGVEGFAVAALVRLGPRALISAPAGVLCAIITTRSVPSGRSSRCSKHYSQSLTHRRGTRRRRVRRYRRCLARSRSVAVAARDLCRCGDAIAARHAGVHEDDRIHGWLTAGLSPLCPAAMRRSSAASWVCSDDDRSFSSSF